MNNQNPFKWRHDEADIILLCVRWYLRYSLSYRDLEEMMRERGLHVDHTTIYRWVQRYAPELEKRCKPHLNTTTDSWRVDETYVKVKKVWMYLYRAVDSQGNTLEFLLSATRDSEAAKRFFAKTLAAPHTTTPRVIAVDKNAAYPKAFNELQAEGAIADSCELRQVKSPACLEWPPKLNKSGASRPSCSPVRFCNTAHERLSRWIKPSTTSRLLRTFVEVVSTSWFLC